MKNDFVHLHLHSQYSLLDGAIKFDELFQEVSKQGMSAVALTDHGNLFGAWLPKMLLQAHCWKTYLSKGLLEYL